MSDASAKRSHAGRDLTPEQRYWQLYRAGRRPDLEEFLAGLVDPSPAEVAAVAALDQHERWLAGEHVPAENYLRLLPEGEGWPQASCDIIYGEYLLREQLGEAPPIEEFRERFPSLVDALIRQVELHQALAEPADKPPPTVLAQRAEPVDDRPTIPGYEVLDEIGRGGMGVVFRARQESLSRVVALKVLRIKLEYEALERMWREAHVTARLSHPNIVTIHDAGLAGPWFYIAMEFVDGIDLHRLVERSGPVPVERACDYLRQAAAGLQHAHEQGLVHRDIKPSNLIVTRAGAGETRPEVLKLLDLGLARAVPTGEPDEAITYFGAFMGTPDFIAPEQANDPRGADVRSDLYSLGCTFYYVLTGRPPFGGATALAKLMQHHLNEPPALEHSLPAGLSAIIRKLMSKRAEDRYQTPAELIAALDAFRRGGNEYTRAASSPGPAANHAVPPVHGTGGLGQVRGIHANRRGGGGERGPDGSPLGPARDVETWRGEGHLSAVLCLAISPDGGRLISGGQDRVLCLWQREGAGYGDAPRWRAAGHRNNINAVRFLPDGQRVLSASHDGTIRMWDGAGREVAVWTAHAGPVWGVSVSADGRLALSGGQDRTIRLWDVERGRVLATWPEQASPVSCVALSPDGRLALSGGMGGVAQLWEVSAARPVAALAGHQGRITAAAFSPDGRLVLTGSRDQTARVFAVDGTARETLSGHTWWVTAVAWSRDGTQVATGSGDRTVAVWQQAGSTG